MTVTIVLTDRPNGGELNIKADCLDAAGNAVGVDLDCSPELARATMTAAQLTARVALNAIMDYLMPIGDATTQSN